MHYDTAIDEFMVLDPPDRYETPEAIDDLYVKGSAHYAASKVKQYANAVRNIAQGRQKLFYLLPRPHGHQTIKAELLGSTLFNAICDLEDITEHFPDHHFNPYLELLLSARAAIPPISDLLKLNQYFDDQAAALVDKLESIVNHIRIESRTIQFKNVLKGRVEQCRANHASAVNYINSLFSRLSRLMLVRLDLHYRQSTSRSRPAETNDATAKKHFAMFKRLAKHKFRNVGSIASMEYGTATGHHFHVLLIFNGHKRSADIHMGQKLGDMWVNQITRGRGRYFNCNKLNYRHKGIGTINYDEHDLRQNLIERVLPYLTKMDIWLKSARGGRTFFRSEMLAEASKRVGRKRGKSKLQIGSRNYVSA